MRVLQETPDCLVVEGTTVLAEVGGGCLKMGLMVLCQPVLAFIVFALQTAWAGDPTVAIITVLIGIAVAFLALVLRRKGPGPARRKAATWGARVTTFDAVAGTVTVSDVGTYSLQDVGSAVLDQSDEGGCSVQLRFSNRETVTLSHVYIDEGRVARVLERIQQFLTRLRPQPIPQTVAPVLPPSPSAYEAQTKEEFERALEAMHQETLRRQGEPEDGQLRE
jgi:hypothetical protein